MSIFADKRFGKIETRDGDALSEFHNHLDPVVLMHVVNCRGKMGAGFARQVKQQHPDTFIAYQNQIKTNALRLGEAFLHANIVNLTAQDFYGTNQRQLNYGAFASALFDAEQQIYIAYGMDVEILFPYRMGCDLAGGEWCVVKELIEWVFKKYPLIAYQN